MVDSTLVRTRLIIRYPSEENPERTRSFTFQNLALTARDESIMDLGEAIRSLLYDPGMKTDIIKSQTTDLAPAL